MTSKRTGGIKTGILSPELAARIALSDEKSPQYDEIKSGETTLYSYIKHNLTKLYAIGFGRGIPFHEMSRGYTSRVDVNSLLIQLDPSHMNSFHDGRKPSSAKLLSTAYVLETPFTIKEGLSVIYGGTGSGKSLLIGMLMNSLKKEDETLPFEYIPFREHDPSSITCELELYQKILHSEKDIIFIDSIRTFLYTKGVQGSKGLNMNLFPLLSNWNIMLRAAGKSVFVVINPIEYEEDEPRVFTNSGSSLAKSWLEQLNGSVEFVVHSSSPGKIRIFDRTGGDLVSKKLEYNVLSAVHLVREATKICDDIEAKEHEEKVESFSLDSSPEEIKGARRLSTEELVQMGLSPIRNN